MQIVRDIDTEVGEDSPPERIVAWMLSRFAGRRLAMTTAFGMEGCALIDMIARHQVEVPVLYLDTGFLFPETLELRDQLVRRYPHLRFENRGPSLTPAAQAALYGPELWATDPDRCCDLRKVQPMRDALADVEVWVAGLTRSQSPARADLRIVEWDWQYQLLKVNPLAAWDRARVWEYVRQHDVPYNRLHDRGYPTLGCTHCTAPVRNNVTGEYTREGRWQGREKNECGLHQIAGARAS